jgi:hypothetical protein
VGATRPSHTPQQHAPNSPNPPVMPTSMPTTHAPPPPVQEEESSNPFDMF